MERVSVVLSPWQFVEFCNDCAKPCKKKKQLTCRYFKNKQYEEAIVLWQTPYIVPPDVEMFRDKANEKEAI